LDLPYLNQNILQELESINTPVVVMVESTPLDVQSIRKALENTPEGYALRGILGEGWFGRVYLVYSRTWKRFFALKMLKEQYNENDDVKEWFRREANIWIELGKHPYFVHVFWVDEIAGRLCIVMECLPKNEAGLISLEDYLKNTPLEVAQTLRWAIQFCYGMAYAYSKGVTCHRDIKPKNILIDPNGDVKITDFGLGNSSGAAKPEIEPKISIEQVTKQKTKPKISGKVWGYRSHMPPEWWFDRSACDQRLDVYGFGITLYQMINNGELPFDVETDKEYEEFHRCGKIPQIASPLFPIVERCLEKNPNERYQTFDELRSDLELLLKRTTGDVIAPPVLREMEFWEWNNKGRSRIHLKYFNDALLDFDKALEDRPTLAEAWAGKGICYHTLASVAADLGDVERAYQYRDKARLAYDNATLFDPSSLQAWFNFGNLHLSFRDPIPALECYDQAIQIDPKYALVWINKADAELDLGREHEAINSYKRFLELVDPAQYQFETNLAREKLQELLKNHT
jgi:serine/threonine protein kinase